MIKAHYKWMRFADDALHPVEPRAGEGWFPLDLSPWDGFADEEAAVKALTEYCGDDCWTQDFVLIKVYRHST